MGSRLQKLLRLLESECVQQLCLARSGKQTPAQCGVQQDLACSSPALPCVACVACAAPVSTEELV